MAENLTKIRNRILGSLKWEVQNRTGDESEIQIISVAKHRRHVVSIPQRGDPVREIEYLHELAHAWLAERIHPLLSTAVIVPRPPADVLQSLMAPKRCAADWFADAVLWEWAPKASAREIREHLGYILAMTPEELNGEMLYQGGLICAQALYWKIRPFNVPGPLQPVVDTLLKFPPDRPNLPKMQALLNALAALTTAWRVRAIPDEELGSEVWETCPESRCLDPVLKGEGQED